MRHVFVFMSASFLALHLKQCLTGFKTLLDNNSPTVNSPTVWLRAPVAGRVPTLVRWRFVVIVVVTSNSCQHKGEICCSSGIIGSIDFCIESSLSKRSVLLLGDFTEVGCKSIVHSQCRSTAELLNHLMLRSASSAVECSKGSLHIVVHLCMICLNVLPTP